MSKDRSINALNGHLHDQLERLLNPDLEGEAIEAEIKRSKAIANLSAQIIDGERVINERARIIAEYAPERMVETLMPKEITNAGSK
ncbi:hypothetical protein [uncultured Psychrobacter sp.]|uniref:hypothetical protein n=1 Tax=uncultured Psychrobacter sp. TaxID=259303 RepID=UPI000E9B9E1D|nr:hypothetical protein [Psychrobacter sp.]|tara:strand:+ start:8631 stop:8888 length:258 start_codon:yes stop_codon:yes gene_type:complete